MALIITDIKETWIKVLDRLYIYLTKHVNKGIDGLTGDGAEFLKLVGFFEE